MTLSSLSIFPLLPCSSCKPFFFIPSSLSDPPHFFLPPLSSKIRTHYILSLLCSSLYSACVFVSICLFIYLSIYFMIYLSIYISLYLWLSLSTLCTFSVFLFIHQIYLFVYLIINQSIYIYHLAYLLFIWFYFHSSQFTYEFPASFMLLGENNYIHCTMQSG